MSDKYRLTRSKHIRCEAVPGDPTPKLVTFIKGDVFVPTETELLHHRNRLEPVESNAPLTIGLIPIDGSAPIRATEAVVTVVGDQEKAAQILNQKEPAIREAVRNADEPFLAILADAEALRATPRKRVVDMIASRRKALAAPVQ